MAFDEVTRLLERYEQLARDQGAVAVEFLQPGLTDAEIEDAEHQHGFPFSQDVKAVWSWHNGLGATPEGVPERIGTSWSLPALDNAISHAQMVLDIWNAGDTDHYVLSRWVTFNYGSVSDVIETSNSHLTDSYVLKSDMTASVLNYPILTVAEKLRWYIWAIEHRAWYVEDGLWRGDFDRYPRDQMRHII